MGSEESKGKDEVSIELNRFLDSVRARLYYLEGVLIDRGIGATPQILRDVYLEKLDCLTTHPLCES